MTTTNSITDRNLHHDLQHLTDLLPEAAALVRHCSPEGASNPAPAGAKGGASRPFFGFRKRWNVPSKANRQFRHR